MSQKGMEQNFMEESTWNVMNTISNDWAQS